MPPMKATRPGPVEVKEGEEILAEGETGREMYIIEEGQVGIYRKVGDSERQVRVLEAGDFFGEMGLLDDQPRAATVRALADTKLLLIDHTTFDQMLRNYPEVSIRIMRLLCQRLREAAADAHAAEGKKGGRGGAFRIAGFPMGGAEEKPAAKEPPAEKPPEKAEPKAEEKAEPKAEEKAPQAEEPPPTPPAPAPEAPAPAPRPAGAGRLVSKATGTEIPLPDQAEIRLGRFDSVTGLFPDVDLAPLDTQRLTSRRHAKLLREGAALFVFEEIGTANGTFVNGRRISSGVKEEVRDGDELRFGGVTLVLRLP